MYLSGMKKTDLTFVSFLSLLILSTVAEEKSTPATGKLYSGKPIKALLVTGGCCHNYAFQSMALTNGVNAVADVDWTVVNDGGKGTEAKIALYDNPKWANGYDVVVHNECFANTDDPEYIQRIAKAHKNGKPAVVIHCAMHTYRKFKGDDWRKFLGVTSRKHEHQANYAVKVLKPRHPVMRGFPSNWVTPKDELYVIEKIWPGTVPLAESVSEKTGKAHPVIWVNEKNGTRVFGTTYGHSDATFRDDTFLDVVARGLLWSVGKLQSAKEKE